jgi:hypothetical protein
MLCLEICETGCDLACEVHTTWKPVPGVEQYGYGPGVRFVVNSDGGGVLFAKAKGKGNTKFNRRVGSVRPGSP